MSVYRVKTYNNRSFMKQLCTVVFNTGILPSDWQSFANQSGNMLPIRWQGLASLLATIRNLILHDPDALYLILFSVISPDGLLSGKLSLYSLYARYLFRHLTVAWVEAHSSLLFCH